MSLTYQLQTKRDRNFFDKTKSKNETASKNFSQRTGGDTFLVFVLSTRDIFNARLSERVHPKWEGSIIILEICPPVHRSFLRPLLTAVTGIRISLMVRSPYVLQVSVLHRNARCRGPTVARIDDRGRRASPPSRCHQPGRLNDRHRRQRDRHQPERGRRGHSRHLPDGRVPGVPAAVHGQPGTAAQLREDAPLNAGQQAAVQRRSAARVRRAVRAEAHEEQRGGQEVAGRQAAEVPREPDQRHVPDQKDPGDERPEEAAADIHDVMTDDPFSSCILINSIIATSLTTKAHAHCFFFFLNSTKKHGLDLEMC